MHAVAHRDWQPDMALRSCLGWAAVTGLAVTAVMLALARLESERAFAQPEFMARPALVQSLSATGRDVAESNVDTALWVITFDENGAPSATRLREEQAALLAPLGESIMRA